MSRALAGTRVLWVGKGADVGELVRVLPSIRVALPATAVAVIDENSDGPHPLAAWADYVVVDQTGLQGVLKEIETEPGTGSMLVVARRLASVVAAIAFLVAIWATLVAVFSPPAYLIPSPKQVLDAFLTQPSRFILHAATTAWEAVLGFLVGNSLGIAFAILLARYLRLRSVALPVLISFQAIPIVAFAPLLGVWLGTGLASKVAMAAIICFFPMVVNCLQAFAAVERDFVDLFLLYRASFRITLRRLLLPASSSSIVAALRISAGLAVVGAIVAEMTGADRGLGYLILTGAYRLETDVLFVAMVLSSLLGVAFFQIPKLVELFLPIRWKQRVRI